MTRPADWPLFHERAWPTDAEIEEDDRYDERISRLSRTMLDLINRDEGLRKFLNEYAQEKVTA